MRPASQNSSVKSAWYFSSLDSASARMPFLNAARALSGSPRQEAHAEVEGVHRLLVRIALVGLAALAADDRRDLLAAAHLPVAHDPRRGEEVAPRRLGVALHQLALREHVEHQRPVLDRPRLQPLAREIGDRLQVAVHELMHGHRRLLDRAGTERQAREQECGAAVHRAGKS